MTRTRRDDNGISRPYLKGATVFTSNSNHRAPPRDAKNLVYSGVIMEIIVDFAAPLISPLVAVEKGFPDGGRIERSRQRNGISVDQKGPTRMIGHKTIILKPVGHNARGLQ